MSQDSLQKLLELAREVPLAAADRDAQRRSFAYGNTKIENDRVTREMVDEAVDRIAKSTRS